MKKYIFLLITIIMDTISLLRFCHHLIKKKMSSLDLIYHVLTFINFYSTTFFRCNELATHSGWTFAQRWLG